MMVDPEQEAILRQGTDVWNKWWSANQQYIIDDLNHADISGVNLEIA